MSQMREQRKFEQENNPHYLKGPSKAKVSVSICEGIVLFIVHKEENKQELTAD